MPYLSRPVRVALMLCLASVAIRPATWGLDTWGDGQLLPVPVVPTLAQQASMEGTGVSSVRASFAAPHIAGDLLVAFVRMSTTSQTVSVSDSQGNIYSHAVAQVQTADGSQIHIFYARAKSGSNAVTAKFSAANGHPWLAIYEYNGVNALDRKASASGASTAPKVSVAASANELLFVGAGMPATYTGVPVAGPGFVLSQRDAGHSRAATETARLTTSGTVNAAFGLSTSANWSIAVATFK